jgi:voltage-gated potassium channel
VTAVPGKRATGDPDIRDRLYELLEHDHLPHSVGSRFAQLIVAIIVLDVLAMILASVPEFDAAFGWLFTSIEVLAVVAFALEYLARLWSVVGHSLRAMTPGRARLEYAFSSLGIIDLMAFLPSAVALTVGDRHALVLFGMLPFLKLVRYSPALRSLLAALHAERRTLFGCVVILTGAVLLFATLLYAIEHKVQPDKFGTIPQAMWWAIVTLGTVGYGDVVPVTPLGKIVSRSPMKCGGAISSSPGPCWRGCRCSRISAPPRSSTSCGCCGRRPSRRAKCWCGAATPPRRCISSPRARSRSNCRASGCGCRTARSSAKSRCCTVPSAAAR